MRCSLRPLLFLAVALHLQPGKAQHASDTLRTADTLPPPKASRVFDLGEVLVIGQRKQDTLGSVSYRDIERFNRMNAAEAVDLLPGVTRSASGARNESMVHVRGFDLRQVPVFLDGVPVYIPYDGYVDLARFSTMDLARIDVPKGFTSILLGPNTMGGAINMITRKPASRLDYNGSLALINGNGGAGNLNIGTLRGKYYAQAGIAYIQRGDQRLSADFTPTRHEDGGERAGSGFTDQRVNAKVGFTPTERSEHVLGFIMQHGEKGVPLYAGTDERNPQFKSPRYWKWPAWDKQSFYLMSRTRSRSGKGALSARVYHDRFRNALRSYDDATFTTMDRPYAFESRYNDKASGAQAEYTSKALAGNTAKVAATYRCDEHREHNVGDPVQAYVDHTFSIGLEDLVQIAERWQLVPGASYNTRRNERADNLVNGEVVPHADASANGAVNAQLLVHYQPHEHHRLRLAGSRTSRFATIKDRYSYRMGQAVPNPDLRPEFASNAELGYAGTLASKVQVEAAAFYSRLDDVIQSVDNAVGSRWQMRNAGRAEFLGAELAVRYAPHEKLRFGCNYTHIERRNLSDPAIRFTDVPGNKLFGHADYRPAKWMSLHADAEYNDSRWSTSYGTRTDPFTVVNGTIGFDLDARLTIEGSVNNILDADYAIVEGYPCEGRNFMVRMLFRSR